MEGIFHKNLQIDGNIMNGIWLGTDPSSSFQTTIFGSNKTGSRFKVIRPEFDGVYYFPNDCTGIAFNSGDTHGFILPHYSSGRAWIGAGNADKLNWVKEVAWKEDKSEIMGIFSGSISITSTEHNKITLTESVKVGSKLSISNGGIKIGAGVSKIEVSGNVYFSTGMTEGDSIRSFVYKNDEAIVHNYNRSNGTYEDRPISSFLLSVSEGDILYLYGSNATSGRGVIEDSYLVVKVIG